jgi:hypothetical protein
MAESQNSPATNNPNGTTQTNFTPPTARDRLAEYRDTPVETPNPAAPEEIAEPQADPAEKQPKAKPTSLTELAETLGVEVKDLYAIKFPAAADGKEHTVGELKDMLAERDDFNTRSLQWERDRQAKEASFRDANEQLRVLIKALPKSALSPAILEHAKKKHELSLQAERERTLNAIPEWKDELIAKADLEEISELVRSYGFNQEDVASMADHRTVQLLRDYAKLKRRVDKALAQVEEVKTQNLAKSRNNPAPKQKSKTQAETPATFEAQRRRAALEAWRS